MPVDPMMDYRRAVMILRRALANADASDGNKSMNQMRYENALAILKNALTSNPAYPVSELANCLRKRTCYFNAGLSHGCDYKELLRALDESTYWNSDLTPGRRRKRSLSRRHPAGMAPALVN